MRLPHRPTRALLVAVGLVPALGCGGGLPEVTPGWFSTPDQVETHGRMVEYSYRRSNGPDTIEYKTIEVDGRPVRFKDGYIWKTSWATAKGIEAVAFVARGPEGVAGTWILQLDGDKQILERICEYRPADPEAWDGPSYRGCEVGWNARRKERVQLR